MPDLRTALETALSKAQTTPTIPTDWDDETTNATITEVNTMQTQQATPRAYFQTTNNVTRETFNFVRDNPGHSRAYAAGALVARGFNRTSVHSLLGQMVKQGLIREEAGAMFATQKEYRPLKSGRAYAKQVSQQTQRTVGTTEKIKPKTQRVASTNTLLAEEFDAQKFVDGMTLKQAKAVYDCLRGVFGG